jgi:hypothetical protein
LGCCFGSSAIKTSEFGQLRAQDSPLKFTEWEGVVAALGKYLGPLMDGPVVGNQSTAASRSE